VVNIVILHVAPVSQPSSTPDVAHCPLIAQLSATWYGWSCYRLYCAYLFDGSDLSFHRILHAMLTARIPLNIRRTAYYHETDPKAQFGGATPTLIVFEMGRVSAGESGDAFCPNESSASGLTSNHNCSQDTWVCHGRVAYYSWSRYDGVFFSLDASIDLCYSAAIHVRH